MKLYVARHGETGWNALNKVCGRTDVSLTDKGIMQAERLAEEALKAGVEVIISSPMKRALQTAEPASRLCDVPIITDGRLIEMDYGIYEGVDRSDKDYLANKRSFAYRYPKGESMLQVAARVYHFLDETKEKFPGKKVLLVCHGGVCRIINTYFRDMTNEEFFYYTAKNALLEEYEFEN